MLVEYKIARGNEHAQHFQILLKFTRSGQSRGYRSSCSRTLETYELLVQVSKNTELIDQPSEDVGFILSDH